MNDKNLIKFSDMDPKQHRELSKKGGINSGAERRRRSELKRKAIEMLRTMDELQELTDQEYADFKRWQKMQRKKH
ncbi:MAG TPA: hypothetical protein DEF06_05125 [Clostridiales bacterium]|nr:hypothetical protein [Clostridiales bacterium]